MQSSYAIRRHLGRSICCRTGEAAYRYLKEEYDALEADTGLLYEQIHSNMCRVNLAAWKREQMPLEWLFQMFAETAANTPKQGE